MPIDKFRFVEIADDLAQIIDGGMSAPDIKAAIDRWKSQHPHANHRHWKLTMSPGSPIEVTPMADSNQSSAMERPTHNGYTSTMAMGDRTATWTYEDGQGGINRMSASYSAT
jgi:hypothetical protein